MKALKSYLDSGRSEFVALYGRRRVGKTFLIRMAAEDKFSFYVTGVHGATKAEQLTAFAIAIQKCSGSERLNIQKNWILAFYELSRYLESTQGIVLDTDSVFDVQVKRLHEYKRQQMNAL